MEYPVKVPKDVDFKTAVFAKEVPGTRKPGQTGHYRCTLLTDGKLITTESHPTYPKTAYDCFLMGARKHPKANCLGHRPWDPVVKDYKREYVWQTYEQVEQRRTAIGSGLLYLAQTAFTPATPEKWSVGLWMVNRPEWQITGLALSAYSLVSVSLYETLGPNVVEFEVNHASVNVVFSAPSHIPQLLSLAPKCPTLKVIVCVENFDQIDLEHGGPSIGALPKAEALQAWGTQVGVQVIDFKTLEQLGNQHLVPHKPPSPDDMASICYTSGTTGLPKGAILPHSMMAAASIASGYFTAIEETTDTFQEVAISYLPLSHIYERFVEDSVMSVGGALGFSIGDNVRLIEDIQILKPTFMAAVPRVLNKLYAVIYASTIEGTGIKGALARKAFAAKIQNFRATGAVTHPFWDRLVMNKIKAAVGGRLKMIGLGSAPMSGTALEFLQVAFGIYFQEGYGQTEGAGIGTKNIIGDYTSVGLVGPPQVTNEIKLVDVPELGYRSTDKPHPRGEMYIRGQNVFPGYYKDEAKTRESFTEDGWFKTGDVASVDERGRFAIVDRVKNLIKLSQGEYVAVEKVENVYSSLTLGAQVCVYADSLQDHLVLFVVPDPAALAALASNVTGQQISATDEKALYEASKNQKVIDAALELYTKEAIARKLNGFETAKQLAFRMTPFSIEEDTLTPTLKLKRNVAFKVLKPEADKLFAQYKSQKSTRSKL